MADVRYATVTAPGNGVKVNWDFNFSGAVGTPGYISQDHIKAFTTSAIGVRVDIPVTPDMFIGPTTLRVTPAVPTGLTLTIYRDTPKDRPLVDFATTAILSEASLDRSARQNVYAVAEMVDAFNETKKVVDGVVGNVAAAEAAAIASQASAVASAGSAATAQGQVILATAQANNAALNAQSANDSSFAAFNSANRAEDEADESAASASAAALTLVNFEKRYLGAKATAPTVDNTGAPLAAGAVYYNTTIPQWYVYDSTSGWQVPTNNVIRSGNGAPSVGVGLNGDVYYDFVGYMIYGPKTGGSWGTGVSLVGPSGPGTGNVVGPANSLDSEVAIYNGTTGTSIKRSTLTASVLKIASGILAAAVGAVDYVLPGLITSVNGITMNTAKLLGRTTAGVGRVEEITPGNGLTFTGGVLSVVPAGTTLLATVTTTAGAASVNFLNVFSAQYDNYEVYVDGARPVTTGSLTGRAAVAGVEVSAAGNYANNPIATSMMLGANSGTLSSGQGMSARVTILNANSANTLKVFLANGLSQRDASTTWDPVDQHQAYIGANAMSGFTLAMGGGGFAAGCVIRVYGVSNT